MQPSPLRWRHRRFCNECHACSYPDKVSQAKNTLPAQWVAELVKEETQDHIWIVALNLYADIVETGKAVPDSIIQLWSGGELKVPLH
ncbi:protein of unknown function [Acidithiobacillus ferrivorans]|uniref:Uncharacterized protein n=1 Tax=Acidithiobacillus ferrivorans TaxID=160808 RepID=A0A060UPL3_9PROT|nr:hypothetical protein [Acidithiobacillus ferrivorans]CDQ10532.1 hypothetical protein AFERRI_400313 [Acidithiobacillus ferrivorans]SMH64563.1 protein of unknown function [Acidithiobacillus ferrivorans]